MRGVRGHGAQSRRRRQGVQVRTVPGTSEVHELRQESLRPVAPPGGRERQGDSDSR